LITVPARSPVLAQLSTSLTGISVIRAFGAQNMFVHQFYKYQNTHTSSFYAYLSASSWVMNAVELIAGLYMTSIVVYFVWVPTGKAQSQRYFVVEHKVEKCVISKGYVKVPTVFSDPSALGLTISTTFLFMQIVRVAMSQSTEIGNQMVAVERVIEYTNVKPEAPLRISGTCPAGQLTGLESTTKLFWYLIRLTSSKYYLIKSIEIRGS